MIFFYLHCCFQFFVAILFFFIFLKLFFYNLKHNWVYSMSYLLIPTVSFHSIRYLYVSKSKRHWPRSVYMHCADLASIHRKKRDFKKAKPRDVFLNKNCMFHLAHWSFKIRQWSSSLYLFYHFHLSIFLLQIRSDLFVIYLNNYFRIMMHFIISPVEGTADHILTHKKRECERYYYCYLEQT